MTKVPQPIIDLYDRFTHGGMDRRAFLDRLTKLAGGAAAANAALVLLQSDYAQAQIVAENDDRLNIGEITTDGPHGQVKCYVARLKGGAKRPTVMVIHENRGLNPHIKDVARRMALEGFLVFAPDALTPMGGTPANEDQARDMFGKIDVNKTGELLATVVTAVKGHTESNGKVGAVGFCWGGAMVNQLAWRAQNLDAGVSYYGRQPPADKVAEIKAPLLIHYAEKDDGVNAGIEAYRTALTAAGKRFEMHTYPGTQHAFNNDTGAARYNADAAKLAWQRTVAFFKTHLGDPPKAS